MDASIADELARMRTRKPTGTSRTHCLGCEQAIPDARREAAPGVLLCIECQAERDVVQKRAHGINRRGSKDSQLK